YWKAAELRQYHCAAAAARDRSRVRHLLCHELARRTDESSAIEHGTRGSVQRTDDDVGLRQLGAVTRSGHGRDGHVAEHFAVLHAVLRPDRAAGAARYGPGAFRDEGGAASGKSRRATGPIASSQRWKALAPPKRRRCSW